jgi:hypothetical protein
LGEPGDNLNYSAEKQSYKNFETGAVIHEKFLISKGTPEYIAAKKEMNTVAEKKEQAIAPKAALPSNRVFLKEGVPFKVTPGYWEKKKSQVGKSVFNS